MAAAPTNGSGPQGDHPFDVPPKTVEIIGFKWRPFSENSTKQRRFSLYLTPATRTDLLEARVLIERARSSGRLQTGLIAATCPYGSTDYGVEQSMFPTPTNIDFAFYLSTVVHPDAYDSEQARLYAIARDMRERQGKEVAWAIIQEILGTLSEEQRQRIVQEADVLFREERFLQE
jgi:hypothetical protein